MEQREVDNMLLSMIQKHFPSLPLSDEHTDWGKWLGFARAVYEAGRASPASAPEGFALVPVVPTHAILDVMFNAGIDRHDGDLTLLYRAILAAAPTPPVSECMDPVMTKEELIAAAESIGMRFPGASIPPVSEDQKDAERLNYLQEHGATVHLVSTTNSNLLSFVIGGLHRSKRLNLREAIDAAMQEDKP